MAKNEVKVSEVIAALQKTQEEHGDLPFFVATPEHPEGVSFGISHRTNNITGEEQIGIEVLPDIIGIIGKAIDSILDGGEPPPCAECDKTDCPKHPTKLN